ncbi:conserved hypothetical protein [delta proteobacterium NaphS2]|nr:conserved hypothetical protein [delta proteobacterium NaphS2]
MLEMIPKNCLSLIPFKPEALSSWSEDSDLLKYLMNLLNKDNGSIHIKRRRVPLDYSCYARKQFDCGHKEHVQMAKQFYHNASVKGCAPVPGNNAEWIPEFMDDKNFGLMAKYHVAWSSTIEEILSEGACFSFAHALESESDLDCSILLASNLYYKQALQGLKNFLECILIELFFCDNSSAFDAWKANAYKVPPFRGKDGILKHLQMSCILSSDLEKVGTNLLNGLDVHLAESRLINSGVFNETWAGLLFHYGKFTAWTTYFARSVEFAIHVLKTTMDIWQKKFFGQPTRFEGRTWEPFDDFDNRERGFTETENRTLICRRCGHRMVSI